jgi:MoaA/NifB/PqqE/SkfB family radical SAM enzyme
MAPERPAAASRLVLDGHKMVFHLDRVRDWLAGKRIAPITMDVALTRRCNFKCSYCYSQLQHNEGHELTRQNLLDFADDIAEIGLKAVSLVSDGESTCHPGWADFIKRATDNGVDAAIGTNGYAITEDQFREVLPRLAYVRFNISAAEEAAYTRIHGVSAKAYHQVLDNIRTAVRLKREKGLAVTLGLQMVLTKDCADQVVPLAKLGRELGADYTVIKHCSDSELGELGVDYDWYAGLEKTLKEAEALSTAGYLVKAKWSKLMNRGRKKYTQCLAIPFMVQFSGSGLVAPCGFLFNERYRDKYHIGNIAETRFKDIFRGERYWEVVDFLASQDFDANRMCGTNCLQHKVNEFLWDVKTGAVDIDKLEVPKEKPLHVNFI